MPSSFQIIAKPFENFATIVTAVDTGIDAAAGGSSGDHHIADEEMRCFAL